MKCTAQRKQTLRRLSHRELTITLGILKVTVLCCRNWNPALINLKTAICKNPLIVKERFFLLNVKRYVFGHETYAMVSVQF